MTFSFPYTFRTNEEEKNVVQTYEHRNRDLGIYAALVIGLITLGLSRALIFFYVILQSSKALHGQMFRAALRAPLRFYDTNSVGRHIFLTTALQFSYEISLEFQNTVCSFIYLFCCIFYLLLYIQFAQAGVNLQPVL